jgi:hypothetical protein
MPELRLGERPRDRPRVRISNRTRRRLQRRLQMDCFTGCHEHFFIDGGLAVMTDFDIVCALAQVDRFHVFCCTCECPVDEHFIDLRFSVDFHFTNCRIGISRTPVWSLIRTVEARAHKGSANKHPTRLRATEKHSIPIESAPARSTGGWRSRQACVAQPRALMLISSHAT